MDGWKAQQSKRTKHERTRAQHGGIDEVGTVGGANDEDVLLLADAVHLGQDLVDDAIGTATQRATLLFVVVK